MDEKRRAKRVSQYLQVRYFLSASSAPVQVFTEDISSGGMRIRNPFKIDERFQFPMDVVLESGAVVKVVAKVAWQKKGETEETWEVGLEFVQMENADRELLEKLVSEADG